ncbi:MAG: hypothetical protein M1281_05730 [Chloroflexi bacterium]|nr:hypothetical protein [Chloroflexota bacterium]
MAAESRNQSLSTLDELSKENLALRKELARLQTRNQAIWALLIGISRKLQVSSASIKAAVSSLLNNDIFWDASAQHEFLKTIDSSADEASNLIMLAALAFRFEAGALELKREPNYLQEILSVVQNENSSWSQKLQLEIAFPGEGRLALVDYEYLKLALKLLFEVLAAVGLPPRRAGVFVAESEEGWQIDIRGAAKEIAELLPFIGCCSLDEMLHNPKGFQAEILLKLFVTCHILRSQEIRAEAARNSEGNFELRLTVPAASEQSR